jgi:separase
MVLLESVTKVYNGEICMPIRRARVTVRLLEVLYRAGSTPTFAQAQSMAQEIEALLSMEVWLISPLNHTCN